MKSPRVLFVVALLVSAGLTHAADPTLPDLFRRAKDAFTAGDYRSSLADLDQLDLRSAQPGAENDRAKLLPVMTFYRGANLAALGQKNEAKDAFIMYLGLSPNAAIASPPYPAATVALFEQARKEAHGRSTTMASAYSVFSKPASWTIPPDAQWAESPVRYLLTSAQKKEFSTFTTDAERAAFIEAFWRQLDPTPANDVNEFRTEFERRVAFADATFATPKLAGRFTDAGAVFTFLGPPTYASLSQLSSKDDVMGQLRTGGNSPGLGGMSGLNGGRSSKNTIAGSVGGVPDKEDNLESDSTKARREAWYYRQARLPQGVPYKEVRFDFLTKEGYGTAVLQKDSEPMQTLGMGVENARRTKALN
jgi:GWxTD domain-containing protein